MFSAWQLKYYVTMSTSQRRLCRTSRIASLILLVSLCGIIVYIISELRKIRIVYNHFDGDSSFVSINLFKHSKMKLSRNRTHYYTRQPKRGYNLVITGKNQQKNNIEVMNGIRDRNPKSLYGLVEHDDILSTRRKHLLEACKKYGVVHPTHEETDMYILHLPMKLLYCPVPKVATRFFSAVLYNLGEYKAHKRIHTKVSPGVAGRSLPRHFFYKIIKKFRETATAVLFVRDPYSRLFSAYVDKYFSVARVYLEYGNSVLMYTRPLKFHECGHDVTFLEFIRFVLFTSKAEMDRHYKPITNTCEPCAMKFDVIGKLETFADDTENFLNVIGAKNLSGVIQLMHNESEAHYLEMNARNLLREEQYILKCMSRWEILMRFWRKKQITGVLNRTAILPKRNYSNEQFVKTILEAHRDGGPKKLRHNNRLEAMIEAYSTIPDKELEQLRKLYKLDFLLFNYTDTPDFITKSRNYKATFSYFDLNL